MEKTFPNGFDCWQETHFEVVSEITNELRKDKFDSKVIEKRQEAQGMGGMWELAEELTDEFEKKYEGREWDGDWLEAIEEFLKEKLYS